MQFYKWLPLSGECFLRLDLTAFISSHYTERVMSEAQKGVVTVWTPGRPTQAFFVGWLVVLRWFGSYRH
jgi:hypothetical protein